MGRPQITEKQTDFSDRSRQFCTRALYQISCVRITPVSNRAHSKALGQQLVPVTGQERPRQFPFGYWPPLCRCCCAGADFGGGPTVLNFAFCSSFSEA